MASREYPEAFWDGSERVIRNWETLKHLPNYAGYCLFIPQGSAAVPIICYTELNSEGQRIWHPVHQGPALDQKKIDAFMKLREIPVPTKS